MKIYESRKHVAVTLIFVALPFVALLFFARVGEISTSSLFLAVGTSFVRLMIAYVIAAVLAWICAVLFYRGRRAIVALPIFDVLQSFPTFAALPLATYLWGRSNLTVILFLVITVIWPIFFSIVSSLKLIKRDWEEAVEVSGLRGFDYVRNFLWPISVTGLITGSIIGLGEGWEALVATEIIVEIKSGFGGRYQTFQTKTPVPVIGILGLLTLIFSINKLLWLPLLEWSHHKMEE